MLDGLGLRGDLARAIADVHDHVAKDFSRGKARPD
jgi:hypothetical protein